MFSELASSGVDPLPKLSTACKRRLLAVLTPSFKSDILIILHARTVCNLICDMFVGKILAPLTLW